MGKVDEKAHSCREGAGHEDDVRCVIVRERGAVDEHVIKRIIPFFKELGYESAKIVLKSDQESSVKSVIEAGTRARRDTPTMPECSPVRSSGSYVGS